MRFRLLIYLVTTVFVSCVSPNREITREAPDLQSVEGLKPGQATKDDIRSALGSPMGITDLASLPGAAGRKDLGELWEYKGEGNVRIEVSFVPNSNVLATWTWHVPENSPGQNLRTAMAYFPSASWAPETVKWINPHSFPNECYFHDHKLGISIEYNRARQKVMSITGYEPSRKLTAEEDEKPPQYCLAVDPNLCTPAVSSKEFFKEWSISKYCEIPK